MVAGWKDYQCPAHGSPAKGKPSGYVKETLSQRGSRGLLETAFSRT